MKIKFITPCIAALTLLGTTHLTHAGTHTWRGGISAYWSHPGNWDEGVAPKPGETPLGIVIPANPTRDETTNNITGLLVDSITFQGAGASIHGDQVITFRSPTLSSLLISGQNNVIGSPLALTGPHSFIVGANGSLTLSGPISGNGGFKKLSRGSLTLSGPAPNTYTGRTEFRGEGGTLHLDKGGDLFDAIAIPGDLVVGDVDQNDFPISVIHHRSNQVVDSANVFVGPNCTYALNGTSEGFQSLALVKGAVTTASLSGPVLPGNLTLFNQITVSNSTANLPAGIAGVLTLAAAERIVDIQDYSVLALTASVRDGIGGGDMKKIGTGTLRLSGSSTFHGKVIVAEGTAEVLHANALGLTTGSTYVQSGATLRLGAVNIVGEHLYLNGAGSPFGFFGAGALEVKSGSATWSGPITLQTDTILDTAENSVLTLNGVVDGPGALTLNNLGTVQLAGNNNNTYAGATYAHGGLLLLAKSAWTVAVPGPFFIAQPNALQDSDDIPTTNVVRLLSMQQLQLGQPVHLDVSGRFDLNGYVQSVGPLTMVGAVITNQPTGALLLSGDVTGSSPWNNSPSIYGDVSLGGTSRTVTSLTPGAISIYGRISDGGASAGIIKKGPYGLRLDGTNNLYTGVTDIREGWLSALQPGSLGAPTGGTIVAPGAELIVGLNYQGGAEPLTLKDGSRFYSVGYNSWDGDITVAGDARIIVDTAANNETLDLNGTISGPGGISFEVGGTLRFGGTKPNTYSGPTRVQGYADWGIPRPATLELRKPHGVVAVPGALTIGNATNAAGFETVRVFSRGQIGALAPVTVNTSGLLDLNSKDTTIGSLAGAGLVDLQLGALTNGGNNADTTFSGTIKGTSFASQFFKIGTGSLHLTGNNTLTGSMMIDEGHLYVNGQQTSSIFVNPKGHLHGRGTIGYVHGLGGRTVPGDNPIAPTHGRLKSWSVDLSPNSSFNIDLGGTQEGVDYDQLDVTGTVNLGGATFYLTRTYAGAPNDQFVIIRNDGNDAVQGTFAYLSEGSTFIVSGLQFKISYQGGDGNDVVVTLLSVPKPAKINQLSVYEGHVELIAEGTPGVQYRVDANGDLSTTNWVAIGLTGPDASGKMYASDFNSTNYPVRFYRFVVP